MSKKKRTELIQTVMNEIDALGIKAKPKNREDKRERPKHIYFPQDLAPLIDHTNLRPEATHKEITKLCEEAKRFQFYGVCINPVFIEESRRQLDGTDCKVITVIGFPLGSNMTATKAEETKQVIHGGAQEVDMVISIGALKDRDYRTVYRDIHAVVETAGSIPVKAIIETGLLLEKEKIAACMLAERAGAAFVKTSTGFFEQGATPEDVKLMRNVLGDKINIKAAGGIRNFQNAKALVQAGATRLGCSASVSIVTESPCNEKKTTA